MYALRTTLAGAILAELELIGAIGLEGKHVRATGTAPQTDLQHELELIRGKSRPHTPKRWVSMFEGRAEVQRVYEGMAARGIVEHVGEKHLGVFNRRGTRKRTTLRRRRSCKRSRPHSAGRRRNPGRGCPGNRCRDT